MSGNLPSWKKLLFPPLNIALIITSPHHFDFHPLVGYKGYEQFYYVSTLTTEVFFHIDNNVELNIKVDSEKQDVKVNTASNFM